MALKAKHKKAFTFGFEGAGLIPAGTAVSWIRIYPVIINGALPVTPGGIISKINIDSMSFGSVILDATFNYTLNHCVEAYMLNPAPGSFFTLEQEWVTNMQVAYAGPLQPGTLGLTSFFPQLCTHGEFVTAYLDIDIEPTYLEFPCWHFDFILDNAVAVNDAGIRLRGYFTGSWT